MYGAADIWTGILEEAEFYNIESLIALVEKQIASRDSSGQVRCKDFVELLIYLPPFKWGSHDTVGVNHCRFSYNLCQNRLNLFMQQKYCNCLSSSNVYFFCCDDSRHFVFIIQPTSINSYAKSELHDIIRVALGQTVPMIPRIVLISILTR